MKRVFLVFLVLSLVVSVYAGGLPEEKRVSTGDIKMGTMSVGMTQYMIGVAFSEVISEATGRTVRVQPGSTDLSIILPLRSGEVDFVTWSGSRAWAVSNATDYFASEEWGPQPIRQIFSGQSNFGFYTTANNPLNSLYDLKGKKIAYLPVDPAPFAAHSGLLAAAGLTWDDVVPVEVAGAAAARRAVVDGAVDLAQAAMGHPDVQELMQSRLGLKWLMAPHDDDAWWSVFQDYAPFYWKGVATFGAGVDANNPLEVFSFPNSVLVYENQDYDLVYAIAEAIYDGYDIYAPKHQELEFYWTQELLGRPFVDPHPLHDAVVQLLKDRGVWTDEHERWQVESVKQCAARRAAWPLVVESANKIGIKTGTEEFNMYWQNYLKENGLMSRAGNL